MNRRPRYSAQTGGAWSLLDGTPGREVWQNASGKIWTGPIPGIIDARAPQSPLDTTPSGIARREGTSDGTGVSTDAEWAATFRGNSLLGVAAGFDATNPAIGNAANRIFGRKPGAAPTMDFDSTGNAQPVQPSIDDVIAQGEAYHKANGIPLPDMNNPNQTLYPDAGGSGAIFGNPAGDAAQTVLKYGEPGASAFTQYGG